MAQLVIAELGDDVIGRLEGRAKRHGRSIEEEACAILEEAAKGEAAPVFREDERGVGDLMYERFKNIGLSEDEVELFNEGIAEFNAGSAVKLDDELKERLRVRARQHGRTLQSEVKAILEQAAGSKVSAEGAVEPPVEGEKGFGTRLHEHFKDIGLTKSDLERFNRAIDEARKEPARFVKFKP
jgi:antitoxin FitA